jgi:hypothetical protein
LALRTFAAERLRVTLSNKILHETDRADENQTGRSALRPEFYCASFKLKLG